MKKLTLIYSCLLILASNITAQVVTSQEVKIHINNKTATGLAEQTNIMFQVADNSIYGRYYALVIAIDNYKDPDIKKLSKPAKLADRFYDVITTRYSFEKNNVTLLKDPTFAEIENALDSFAKKVGTSDNFLIFFEGEGYWDASTQTGFWLASDARGTGYLFLPSDDAECKNLSWLSNAMMINFLRKITSKHTLMVTNASFAGTALNVKTVDTGPSLSIGTLNELAAKRAITDEASANNNVQSEFLKALIENLEKNSEKYLPAEKLFINALRTFKKIENEMPRFGQITDSGDNGGDFIFILRD